MGWYPAGWRSRMLSSPSLALLRGSHQHNSFRQLLLEKQFPSPAWTLLLSWYMCPHHLLDRAPGGTVHTSQASHVKNCFFQCFSFWNLQPLTQATKPVILETFWNVPCFTSYICKNFISLNICKPLCTRCEARCRCTAVSEADVLVLTESPP